MKLDTTTHLDVQSNMTGERVAMGIAAEDMAHIMDVLTNLYKNRLLAIIREYSTNAWDAHIEAGVSLPIEVTLPSAFSPILKIRDYGVGLSAEDIRLVYSQYGRSTKRNTNDQVGMLGLGCKSGLTYAEQFTVASVKDGRRITVVVRKTPEGSAEMLTISDVETSDANGTEVSIAIQQQDMRQAQDLAAEFFSFWSEDSVLVNGRPPARFKGLKLAENLYMTKEQGKSRIVMGNVAYPYDFDLENMNHWRYGYSLVAFVPIGSVQPTPSRESLKDTPTTKATAKNIGIDYRRYMLAAVQREINAAETGTKALEIIREWNAYLDSSEKAKLTYKGTPIPVNFEIPGSGSYGYNIETNRLNLRGRGSGAIDKRSFIPSIDWPHYLWLEGFKPEKFTAQHKKKLRQWMDEQGMDISYTTDMVLLRGSLKAPRSKFIDPSKIVTWDTIKAIKLPVVRSAYGAVISGRIPGSYDVYTESGFKEGISGDEIRRDKPIFWEQANKYEADSTSKAIRRFFPEFTLVCLGANRIEKFKRNVPEAQSPWNAMRAEAEKMVKKVTDNDRLIWTIQSHNHSRSLLRRLDATRIDDPELRKAVEYAKVDKREVHDRINLILAYASNNTIKPVDWDNPVMKYELLAAWSNNDGAIPEHMYLYLNAAYAAN